MAYMDVPAETQPNGRTVVLLHGMNFYGAYWAGTIDVLRKEGFRVVVPDQVGFGRSTKAVIPTPSRIWPPVLEDFSRRSIFRKRLLWATLAQQMVYEDPVVYDWAHIKAQTMELGGDKDGPNFSFDQSDRDT